MINETLKVTQVYTNDKFPHFKGLVLHFNLRDEDILQVCPSDGTSLAFKSPRRHILEMLELSKEKWEFIEHCHKSVEAISPKIVSIKEGGPSTCACCANFFDKDCKGCPIFKYTEQMFCEETPYDGYEYCGSFKTNMDVAGAEVDFLQEVIDWVKENEL